jgi:sulfite reductase (ferredoxin)
MSTSAADLSIYQLPDTLPADIEQLAGLIARTQAGEMSGPELRAHRVPMGIYEQREQGTFMLRVRLPGGVLLPAQMRALADIARQHGNGVLHVTTRQDVQVHRVPLDHVTAALRELLDAGLATKGGGGNTVRNITACERAGVCAAEPFDVTPYAVAVTEYLLPDPLSYQLPRKYKIAFTGCPHDHAGARVNDVGFVAQVRDGVPGFRVYAGGGMGGFSRVGDLLEEFIPAGECHLVSEAIKRVFDQHGNRRNKHRARLRFLVEQIGFEAFRVLYEQELAALKASSPRALEVRPIPEPAIAPVPATASAPAEGFEAWRERLVAPQKQGGYNVVLIPLVLGDITAEALEGLAEVVAGHGEGSLRGTQRQNLALRWVAEEELPALHTRLTALGLGDAAAPIVREIVSCAGASTCQLGICLSRGLATAITAALPQSALDLQALGNLTISISGCPNACGRHPLADIGLCGAARRVNERLVPHYQIHLGGGDVGAETRLAAGKAVVPARNVPAYLVEFLQAFGQSPAFPDFRGFLESGGREAAETLAEAHQHVPPFEEDETAYTDWGASQPFSLAGRGPGECSAGVFDLIDMDMAAAAEALEQGRLYKAAVSAARALLITKGEAASDDRQAFELFAMHFLAEAPEAVRGVIFEGVRAASLPDPAAGFAADAGAVATLVAHVKQLYDAMDASLRATTKPAALAPEETQAPAGPDVAHDFRGVACPLNYVKTTMALSGMESGQVLSVLLNDQGAGNVPDSVKADGHEVLAVSQQDDHWQVLIRKQ